MFSRSLFPRFQQSSPRLNLGPRRPLTQVLCEYRRWANPLAAWCLAPRIVAQHGNQAPGDKQQAAFHGSASIMTCLARSSVLQGRGQFPSRSCPSAHGEQTKPWQRSRWQRTTLWKRSSMPEPTARLPESSGIHQWYSSQEWCTSRAFLTPSRPAAPPRCTSGSARACKAAERHHTPCSPPGTADRRGGSRASPCGFSGETSSSRAGTWPHGGAWPGPGCPGDARGPRRGIIHRDLKPANVMIDLQCPRCSGAIGTGNRGPGRLTHLAQCRYVDPVNPGIVCIGLGDLDQAFACLERAFEEHSEWLCKIHVDPVFDPCAPIRGSRIFCSGWAEICKSANGPLPSGR